jgi:hypothetical protein
MNTKNNDSPYFNPIDYIERNESQGSIILAVLLFICLAGAAFGLHDVNYENYCKEPQAKCQLNNPNSGGQTVSNIFNTLKNGPK